TPPPLPGRHRHAPVAAIGLWIAAAFLFTAQSAILKWLADDYHFSQILFGRSVIVVLGTSLMLLFGSGLGAPFRTRKFRLHALRFLCFFVALTAFIEAVRHIKLADAVAVSFAAPLLMTALSVPLLGEKVGVRRWTAVAIGLCGVAVISNPTTGIFEMAALWALLAAFAYALAIIVTRVATRTEETVVTVFWLNAIYVVLMPVFAPFTWIVPTWEAVGLFAACGLIVMVAQLVAVQACTLAPPQVLAPFDYTAMIWAILLGFFIWGDLPSWTVVGGATILIASGLYVWWREAQQEKLAR
ncbi:MAG: DMT family transporter, partial [Rhodospirillaceae bacterium]|nr:DMT family transporter [Rhodospirillaceae bacterium]